MGAMRWYGGYWRIVVRMMMMIIIIISSRSTARARLLRCCLYDFPLPKSFQLDNANLNRSSTVTVIMKPNYFNFYVWFFL